ncbi:unnamed protein product [Mucor hiemalis]
MAQCQLLCKTWRNPAQKQLYKTVELRGVSNAEKFLKSMSVPANHASKLVRLLVLKEMLCDSPKLEFIFPRLFEMCPNITRLRAPPGQSSSFWAKLLMVHAKGNVSHLREIPLTDLSNDDNIKCYGYVAYLMRSQLSTLTMCDWPSYHPSFQHDMVARQMKEFQHLKQLNVHLRGGRSIYQVFSFIQSCPSLKSIDISVTDINRRLNSYKEEDDRISEWYDIRGDSLSQIERLNVEYVPLTSKIIGYILKLFPKLKELYFKSDNPNWEEDMELLHRVQIEGLRISTDLWLSFLLHLYNHVPTFDISNLFMAQIPYVLSRLIKQTDYGETMKIVYLERDTFFDFQPFVGIDHKSASRKYARGCKFYDDRTIEVVYAAEEDHYEVLPHLELLEKVGHSLKGLEIQIHQADRFDDRDTDLYNMACGGFLNPLLKTCPLLETLSLKKCHLFSCEQDSSIMGNIQILRLIDCTLLGDFFDEFVAGRLPLLSHLVVHRCMHTTRDGILFADSNYLSFPLHGASLDILRITGLRKNNLKEVFLNVQSTDDYFLRISADNRVARTTEEAFDDAMDTLNNLCVSVHCDVKTLVLEVNSSTIDLVLRFDDDNFVVSNLTSSAYINNIKEIQ